MEVKTIAITGASGNMGRETFAQLMELSGVRVKALMLDKERERKLFRKWRNMYGERIEAVFGDISDMNACRELVKDSDYVLNIAGVIPPEADKRPEAAYSCNLQGAKNITDAVCETGQKQPKLIHISTVAVYGCRNHLHPWGRVGDPLLPSAYDSYAVSKIKGERYVLDSAVKTWAVLRQTGILHDKMLFDNMKDGLMFHTCYNTLIEWVTARDSGRLMRRIVELDIKGQASDFWMKCYNIGGGANARVTGYETFDQGFAIINGSVEKFMKPSWNALRNFHCMWFYDSDVLQDMFDFRREGVHEYWQKMEENHKIYKFAKLLPPGLISKFAVERLLKDKNAPVKWIKDNMEGKVRAYFGAETDAERISDDWKSFPLLFKGKTADGEIDYEALKDKAAAEASGLLAKHGYDENKPVSELDIADMREAAEFRGGKCISPSMRKGDLYTKLEWECHDGHRFWASPYVVLKAGHWCPQCCLPEPWDYDRLAKFMPFYAQIWYDTHSRDENMLYYYDKKGRAAYRILNFGAHTKKAAICVFSGTGNTLKIAGLYKKEFEKNSVSTDIFVIKDGKNSDVPDPGEYDFFGLAYPIHAFNAPKPVLDFARRLPKTGGKNVFVVKSSGEPLPINNISSLKLISVLEGKGYSLTNEYHYVMPYNMIFRHSDGMAAKMWATAAKLCPVEAREILAGKEHRLDNIPFGSAIAALFRIEHSAMQVNGRLFRVNKNKCINCGLCVKNCPVHNVSISEGNIVFGGNCLCCTRCSFYCPTNAINIGILNSWKVNGAYDFDVAADDCETPKHKNYCKKAYDKYFRGAEDKTKKPCAD
jgi:nucleoside-diphosphate-sugar epimerase/ferredoxin